MSKDPLWPLVDIGRAGARGDLSTPGPGANEVNEAPWPTPRCEWRRLGGTRSSLDSKPPLAAAPGATRRCGRKPTPQDGEGWRASHLRPEGPRAEARPLCGHLHPRDGARLPCPPQPSVCPLPPLLATACCPSGSAGASGPAGHRGRWRLAGGPGTEREGWSLKGALVGCGWETGAFKANAKLRFRAREDSRALAWLERKAKRPVREIEV